MSVLKRCFRIVEFDNKSLLNQKNWLLQAEINLIKQNLELETKEKLFYKELALQEDVQLRKERKESKEKSAKLERERDVLHAQSFRDKNRYVSLDHI